MLWGCKTGAKGPTALASISVVIPAYNAQDTIGDAIDSVKEQTLPVHEIIVVDDGSEDRTAELVAARYPDVRVERVANGGPSKARNVGIDLASGDWVAFLDADDRWHPDKLSAQLALRGDSELVASDWVRQNAWAPVPELVPKSRLDYRALLTMNQFQTSTVVMTRQLAERLGGFDTAVDGAEDWDFWLRASQYTPIVKVNWPLVQYRDVPTGYSKDVWRVYTTMQPMLDKHRGTPAISAKEFSVLESWHHLRFWVAFSLSHDQGHARTAWRNAIKPGLRSSMPRAFVQYLVPFLYRRIRRRAS